MNGPMYEPVWMEHPDMMIRPLTLQDVPDLRLGWSSRLTERDIEEQLIENPGLSLWSPQTLEYIVGGKWRHRDEIAGVVDLAAISGAVVLLQAFAAAAEQAGKRLVIATEHAESRRQAFYQAAGYDRVEEIIIYELDAIPSRPPIPTDLRFERASVDDPETLRALLDVDNRAFPWLWWNCTAEFIDYGHSPGVSIYLGRDPDGRAVSYLGVTLYRNWGHLDRIAVIPETQGTGYGLQSLDWAVRTLGRAGARRVGLSTQVRNTRSRRLYENYGFHRSPAQDYALYGRWVGPAEVI